MVLDSGVFGFASFPLLKQKHVLFAISSLLHLKKQRLLLRCHNFVSLFAPNIESYLENTAKLLLFLWLWLYMKRQLNLCRVFFFPFFADALAFFNFNFATRVVIIAVGTTKTSATDVPFIWLLLLVFSANLQPSSSLNTRNNSKLSFILSVSRIVMVCSCFVKP